MKNMDALTWITTVLVIVGALNWGLVGFLQFDLVATLFGGMDTLLARVVYSLVGVSAIWIIVDIFKK